MNPKDVWKRIFGFKEGDKVMIKVKDRRFTKGHRIETGFVVRDWVERNTFGETTLCYIVQCRRGALYVRCPEDLEKVK